MKKIKIIAGITWAFLCLILILVLFPRLNSFSDSASKLPFMKINPNYSGGEVAYQITAASCTTDIRKPVFEGLINERKKGFVQIDWRGNIPDEITDTIDYDLDKKADFYVTIVRSQSKTSLKSFNSRVGEVLVSTPTSYGWALRVMLKND